jgi:hypothetical protein
MATAAVPPFAVLRMRWFSSRRNALRSSATDAAVTACRPRESHGHGTKHLGRQ